MKTDVVAFAALTGLIGFVVGSILGLNGFAQPVGATALSQTPRIKNLGWLLSGFFVLYLADPKRLNLREDFPFIWPFICYGTGAVAGLAFAVGMMVLSIRLSVNNFRQRNGLRSDVDSGALLREYLTYGKARFDDAWDKAKTHALDAAREQQREANADMLAAECVHKITRQLGAQRRLPESDLMDSVLEAICAKANTASGRQVKLTPSYFAFVAHEQADDILIATARFTSGMPGGYTGYLVLRRGSQRLSDSVILPISKIPAQVLPGAPEAVLLQGFSVLNTRSIRFRTEVSKQARAELMEFYRHPYFANVASIASLLVYDKETFHGVINIESPEVDLLGIDKQALNIVVTQLQPLVALLAVFR